jgi:PAS domain S-box-containing protein
LPEWLGYAVAVGLNGLLAGGLWLIRSDFWFYSHVLSLYVIILIFLAYLFGARPAIFAYCLGVATYTYLFIIHVKQSELVPIYKASINNTAFIFTITVATIYALSIRRSTLRTHKLLQDARKSLAQTKEILESLGDPIFVLDKEGRYAFVNKATERYLQRSEQELLNKSIAKLYLNDIGLSLYRVCHQATAKKATVRFETFISRLDKWIEGRIFPVSNGLAVHFRDVGKRKQVEEHSYSQNVIKYLDAVNAIVIVLNKEGKVELINRLGSNLLGYPREKIVGKNWFSNFVPPDCRYNTLRTFDDLISGKTEKSKYTESYILNHTGQKRLIAWHNTVLEDNDGRICAVLCSGEDVTDKKETEEIIQSIERQKVEFYRRMVLAATDHKLMLVDESAIDELSGQPIATWTINDPKSIGVVRHCVKESAELAGMNQAKINQFVTCIGEAATNAWKHAGGGYASLHRLSDGLVFVVKDKGPGIDPLNFPDVALKVGYSTAHTLGAGYKVMINLADRVYLATSSTGTTVAIEMKFADNDILSFSSCSLEEETSASEIPRTNSDSNAKSSLTKPKNICEHPKNPLE